MKDDDLTPEERDLDDAMQAMMQQDQEHPVQFPEGETWENLGATVRQEVARREQRPTSILRLVWPAAACLLAAAFLFVFSPHTAQQESLARKTTKTKVPSLRQMNTQQKVALDDVLYMLEEEQQLLASDQHADVLTVLEDQLALDRLALELAELGFNTDDAEQILGQMGQDDVLREYVSAIDFD